MDNTLKEAIRLRKLGFAIHWLLGGEKRPIEGGWSEAAVMSVEQLIKTYRTGYNVGFRPGKYSVVAGHEIVVLDVDIRGGPLFAEEAYAAAKMMMGSDRFDVMTGSVVGRHRFLGFPIGKSPGPAATTLRQSDIWVIPSTGQICNPKTDGARPAWLIELLSTGKNVVLPPSIHPDTGKPYKFLN